MTVLNLADDVRLGASQADKVYLGTVVVWEPATVAAFPFARPSDPATANAAEKWLPA